MKRKPFLKKRNDTCSCKKTYLKPDARFSRIRLLFFLVFITATPEKVMKAERDGRYVQYIQEIIKKYGGLWFNNEMLVIEHQE
jgi:hypothetical protein